MGTLGGSAITLLIVEGMVGKSSGWAAGGILAGMVAYLGNDVLNINRGRSRESRIKRLVGLSRNIGSLSILSGLVSGNIKNDDGPETTDGQTSDEVETGTVASSPNAGGATTS